MDNSIHRTSTGKIFQMRDGFCKQPMSYDKAKHNYTRHDLATMKIGQAITFMPMYGNVDPVYSILIRLR